MHSNGIESHYIVGKAKDKQGADSLRVPRDAKEKHRYESHSWQGMEKQRHGVEKLSPDQKCKETALNCWKGKETALHSWQSERSNDKQRHGMASISLAVKRTGQARKKTEA